MSAKTVFCSSKFWGAVVRCLCVIWFIQLELYDHMFRSVSFPIMDRIVFFASRWCSAHGYLKQVTISDMERNWEALVNS